MPIFYKTKLNVLIVLLEYIDLFSLSGNMKQTFGRGYPALYHSIDASLPIVVFSINDPDLPYMIYFLWIYVRRRPLSRGYLRMREDHTFFLLVSDDSGSDRHCITRYVHRCLTV